MQLMPETARQYGVRNVFDPEENIRGGIQNLADLSGAASRRSPSRPGRVQRRRRRRGQVSRRSAVRETMTYVKRALTVYYGTPYAAGVQHRRSSRWAQADGRIRRGVAPVVAMLPGMRYHGTR